MGLLALAGGVGPGGEAYCACCGWFLVLPTVVILSLMAVSRASYQYAIFALALAGLPLAVVLVGVANYQPSTDWEVADEQELGRSLVWWFAGMLLIAALSLLLVAARRGGWLPDPPKPDPGTVAEMWATPPSEAIKASPDTIQRPPQGQEPKDDDQRAGDGG
ncbi:MAG: hypothetical protein K2W96_02570 [Gemmataceae bacterium]|nr:hypothetical protein [Gemmataceae bacterium]